MGRVRNKEEEAKALQEAAQKVITGRISILVDSESEIFINSDDFWLKHHFSDFFLNERSVFLSIDFALTVRVFKLFTLTFTLKSNIPKP